MKVRINFKKIRSVSKVGVRVAIAAMFMLAMPSSAFASTVYTSFQTVSPTSHGVPGKMTMANGSFWYVENSSHYIGNMSTAGSVIADYDISAGAAWATNIIISSLVAGSDGNVWFNGSVSGQLTVGSLNTTTGITTYYTPPSSVSGASHFTNIVSASDGNIWYAAKGIGGALDYTYFVKIDPLTGVSTVGHTLGDYYADITSLTGNSLGGLSYTDQYMYNNRVDSFTIGSGSGPRTKMPTAYSNPSYITSGPDGNIWLTEGGKIAKITMAGTLTEYTLPTGVAGAMNLITGSDGALWFTASSGSSQIIGRITTSGSITHYALPVGVTSIRGLAWGPDDTFWFSASSNGGELVKMSLSPDYAAHSTTSPTSYGTPGQITVANGTFWYLETTSGSPSQNHFIGNMTTSGTVLADYDLDNPASPVNPIIRSITTGSDGNVWFIGSVSTHTVIGSLNVTTGAVTYYSPPSSIGTPSTNLVAASDGNLWFGSKGVGGALDYTYFVKIDPSTGVSTVGYTDGDYYADVTSLASSPDGSLWYTDEYMYNHRISSFTTGGVGGPHVTIPGMYSSPRGLTIDPSGNKWLLESGNLAKVTSAGILTEYTGVSGSQLTVSSDGALWFITSSGISPNLGRITTSGSISQYAVPAGVTTVSGLVFGPDDNIWFSTGTSGGELVKAGYY